ncbi:MAG: glycerol-3-phosphate dehydrogenase/oxidase [Anaerolineales bacterium]|nr:glycerol-3-phosphate dehydrogenase/oxidase [Anaerolineales bacterium]
MQPRENRISKIKENNQVSVLIIGAGINGIGTFRDLALQGVDVLMVDRADYCSGASAASSHMVHGGIRYLENGEFRLVREAVRERNRLIDNVPHLVKPLPTTFPVFKWLSGLLNAPLKFLGLLERPSERGAVVIKIGMMLYDYYTRNQKTVPQHVFLNRKDSLQRFPELNPQVLFTGTYYDGAMPSPERIAIELIKDAVEANHQAVPLNYVSFVSACDGTVTLKDEISGELFDVRPKVLVNAAGPWIDLVNKEMGRQTNFISGTKGSHLILDNPRLRQAIGDNEFFFENKDGRIVLIFPLEDKVMIGTSDLRIDDPDDAIITADEVWYFFEMVQRVFPGIELDISQIVYTFSGVRPLEYTKEGATGQISRDHKVYVIDPGDLLAIPVLSLVGGKWTSFRAFSEQAADLVLDHLGIERSVSTEDLSIGGSRDFPRGQSERMVFLSAMKDICQSDENLLTRLFETYGTNVEPMLRESCAEIGQPLKTISEMSVGEIKYLAANEDIVHLDDLILRRTMIGKLGRVTPDSLEELAEICASSLNWSHQKTLSEMQRFINLLRRRHKMNFNLFLGEQAAPVFLDPTQPSG